MKPFWKSTTVWVNTIPVIVLIIQFVTDNYILDPDVVVILTAIANILNRIRAPKKIQKLSMT